jgi:cytochrome c5
VRIASLPNPAATGTIRALSLTVPLALSPLAGCDDPDAGAPAATDVAAVPAPEIWAGEGYAEAKAIYERACASCHDPGAGDAPTIGVREDWDGRSRIWVAVLSEHAKQGYLEMPAKGGATELTDKQVGAAAEYILAVTYPDLPLD